MNIAFYPILLVLSLSTSIKKEVSKNKFYFDNITTTNTNDSLNMIKSVKEFLQWYRVNYTKANSFKFTFEDNKGNYQVNLSACEDYLKYLKSSGYISDEYISLWMKYFTDKATYLKENPQNEGPSEGFEFDLVLITQEPELILNAIETIEFLVVETKENKAILNLTGEWMYDIDMTKVTWLLKTMIENILINVRIINQQDFNKKLKYKNNEVV